MEAHPQIAITLPASTPRVQTPATLRSLAIAPAGATRAARAMTRRSVTRTDRAQRTGEARKALPEQGRIEPRIPQISAPRQFPHPRSIHAAAQQRRRKGMAEPVALRCGTDAGRSLHRAHRDRQAPKLGRPPPSALHRRQHEPIRRLEPRNDGGCGHAVHRHNWKPPRMLRRNHRTDIAQRPLQKIGMGIDEDMRRLQDPIPVPVPESRVRPAAVPALSTNASNSHGDSQLPTRARPPVWARSQQYIQVYCRSEMRKCAVQRFTKSVEEDTTRTIVD